MPDRELTGRAALASVNCNRQRTDTCARCKRSSLLTMHNNCATPTDSTSIVTHCTWPSGEQGSLVARVFRVTSSAGCVGYSHTLPTPLYGYVSSANAQVFSRGFTRGMRVRVHECMKTREYTLDSRVRGLALETRSWVPREPYCTWSVCLCLWCQFVCKH